MRSRVFLAAALAVASVALGSASAVKPTCSIPILFAEQFSGLDTLGGSGENTLAWGLPDPAVSGSGYKIQVALQPVTKQGGEFADLVDGKPNIVYSGINVPEGFNTWTVEGLEEKTYYYHLRVAPNSTACDPALDPWSNIVATTQDHTPPEVDVTVTDMQVFLPGEVTIGGTATDVPGDEVAAASGADRVRVRLDHTTPLAGVLYPAVPKVTTDVAEDGTWSVTYDGLPPGTYRAEITGWDAVNNATPEPIQVSFVVINA